MSALTVELTGEERAFVEEQVARGVAPSPVEYVTKLIRRQRLRSEEYFDDDISEEEFTAQTRERWEKAKARDPVAFQKGVDRMNELIRESIEGGPSIEMTPEEWDKLWREADEEAARRKGR